MEEVWENINEFPNYQVSNFGNVRNSLTKTILSKVLRDKRVKSKCYYMVSIPNSIGIRKNLQVHRLVAEAFVPNENNFDFVVHKDFNKLNNHYCNLEWRITPQLQKNKIINLKNQENMQSKNNQNNQESNMIFNKFNQKNMSKEQSENPTVILDNYMEGVQKARHSERKRRQEAKMIKRLYSDIESEKVEKQESNISFLGELQQDTNCFLAKITPDIANFILKEKNNNNRQLDISRVDFYLKQIKEGEWSSKISSLMFFENGDLADGQHRLKAIALSGQPIQMRVILNIKAESMSKIDTGKVRTAKDVITVANLAEKYHQLLASIPNAIIQYNNGANYGIGTTKKTPTNTEILNFAQEHLEELKEIISFSVSLNKEFRAFETTSFGFLSYILGKINQNDSDAFLSKLATGVGLDTDSPIYVLRKKLLNNQSEKAKFKRWDKIHLCIVAWNHFRKGHKINHIKFHETFPKPI